MIGERKAYKNIQPFERPEPGRIIRVVNDESFGYAGKVEVDFDSDSVENKIVMMGDMGGTPPLEGQRVRVTLDANAQPFVMMTEQVYNNDFKNPGQKYDVREGQQIFQAFARDENDEGELTGHSEVSRILMDNEGMVEIKGEMADVHFQIFDMDTNFILSSALWMIRGTKLGKLFINAVDLVLSATNLSLSASSVLSASAPTCSLNLTTTNMYGGNVTIDLTGNFDLVVEGDVNLEASGDVNIKAGGTANVDAPSVVIAGGGPEAARKGDTVTILGAKSGPDTLTGIIDSGSDKVTVG